MTLGENGESCGRYPFRREAQFPSSSCKTGGPARPSVEREYTGTPPSPAPWLASIPREGNCDLPALGPPVQWRPAFLDLLVGNLQLRKASVSRMCWPLNLAGEAQVASGREGLASSHLERQRNAGVGEEMWQCWGKEPGFTWLQEHLGTVPFISHT